MKNEQLLSKKSLFLLGAKRLMPIAAGVIPFGLIMGTVASEAGLSLFETVALNTFVYAGASQLAAIELMNQNTPLFVVVLTGLVINLRFLMYSTAMAPLVVGVSPLKKIGLAYVITDQSYAVSLEAFERYSRPQDKLIFYLGASSLMTFVWQVSTIVGAIFGNIAPDSLSLDFAVPLAFASIIIPGLKSKPLVLVALVSSVASILFYKIPFNLGLIMSASLALFVGYWLNQRGRSQS